MFCCSFVLWTGLQLCVVMVKAEAENRLIKRRETLCECLFQECFLIFIPSQLRKDLISDKFSFRAAYRDMSLNSPFFNHWLWLLLFFSSIDVIYVTEIGSGWKSLSCHLLLQLRPNQNSLQMLMMNSDWETKSIVPAGVRIKQKSFQKHNPA